MLVSLLLLGFSGHLLMKSEIRRLERRFSEYVQNISGAVKQRLDTNEAVLAGFAAFLQAVDQSDETAATRFAASVSAAYPHIYMLEVARQVPLAELEALKQRLRSHWRPDFEFKDFPQLAGQPTVPRLPLGESWPVLFMYPLLPEASAIYGVRLETVANLSYALAVAHGNTRPVASPVFDLYEGGKAYILLQEISRGQRTADGERLNFFGNDMVALLVIKTDALLAAINQDDPDPSVQVSALLRAAVDTDSPVFAKSTTEAATVDRLLLPLLREKVEIRNGSQPMTLSFERQLRFSDVLTPEAVVAMLLLVASTIFIPLALIRHFRAIAAADSEHRRSAYLATHDVLTQLPNRYLFTDRFHHVASQRQRSGAAFALMLIDLDHFKDINDRFGHDVGDQVLKAVALRISGELRACDTVARYGGDEFVVLVAELGNPEDAAIVGEKILQAVGRPVVTSTGEVSVFCSIGIALCPLHGENLDDLCRMADQAMYTVKHHGRKGLAVSDSQAAQGR